MPEQLEPIWDSVREELRREAPDFKFHIWLAPLALAGIEGRTLYVRAPDHIRTWVSERYLPLLRAAARQRFDERAVVEVVGEDWAGPPGDRPARIGPPDESPAPLLNPKYSFEQFVIGGGNRFAHAAALAVAEQPAQAYNPLFLHGPPGLGKTHLLHAIGNYVARHGAELQVRYATVEDFTREFVEALRERRTADFKEGFRSPDVLLIDDVQFLAGRERTREEFFHTFNALVESGRQLVVTCDKRPDELDGLEQRLAERFAAGLVVELEPPAVDTRRAILAKRARIDDITVADEVLDEIAGAVTSSVRALEGALIRVVAYASLRGEPPSPELARQLLRRLGGRPPERCDIETIVAATAEQFGLAPEALLARSRQPRAATARQVAMYLARELTERSLPDIGRSIGDRSHTTVLHAIKRVSSGITADAELCTTVEMLRRRLRASP